MSVKEGRGLELGVTYVPGEVVTHVPGHSTLGHLVLKIGRVRLARSVIGTVALNTAVFVDVTLRRERSSRSLLADCGSEPGRSTDPDIEIVERATVAA